MTETAYTREEILEHRQQWVAALRSGTIPQMKSHLGNANGARCCLGVAQDLAGVPFELVSGERFGDPELLMYVDSDEEDENKEALTLEAQAWLGVNCDDPLINDDNASAWNDSHDKTFAEIADLFEEYGFDPDHDVLGGAEA